MCVLDHRLHGTCGVVAKNALDLAKLAPIIAQRSDENLLMAFRAIDPSDGLRGMC